MLKAVRTRQRILATFLPIAAVLYIGCEALDPKGTDQLVTDVATGLKLLAIAARHPTQLYVAATLSLLALGAVAVSYAAIALLITGRGWVIATVAALLGGIGAFCGAITNVLVGLDLAAAATAHASPDAAARFLVTAFNSGAGQVFTYVYFVSEFTAPVVMGFALWRSRRVPLWLAALCSMPPQRSRPRTHRYRVHAALGDRDGPALSQDPQHGQLPSRSAERVTMT